VEALTGVTCAHAPPERRSADSEILDIDGGDLASPAVESLSTERWPSSTGRKSPAGGLPGGSAS
jgi:hypothetical protein